MRWVIDSSVLRTITARADAVEPELAPVGDEIAPEDRAGLVARGETERDVEQREGREAERRGDGHAVGLVAGFDDEGAERDEEAQEDLVSPLRAVQHGLLERAGFPFHEPG